MDWFFNNLGTIVISIILLIAVVLDNLSAEKRPQSRNFLRL